MPRGPKGEKRPTDDVIGAAVMSDMASANAFEGVRSIQDQAAELKTQVSDYRDALDGAFYLHDCRFIFA
jgi:hypothetical protein